MDWLERLINFHQLNGVTVEKYPTLDDSGKVLIYYSLKKVVESLGGYDNISKQGRWKEVCAKLGLLTPGTSSQRIEEQVATTYKKVILPFETFLNFLEYAGVTNGECRYRTCNLHATKKGFNHARKKKHVQQISPKLESTEVSCAVADTSDFHLSPTAGTSAGAQHEKTAPVSPPQSPVAPATKRPRRKQAAAPIRDHSDSEASASGFDDEEPPATKRRRSARNLAKPVVEQDSTAPRRSLRNARTELPVTADPEPLRRSSRAAKERTEMPGRMGEVKPKVEEENGEEVTICEICEQECLDAEPNTISCKECEGLFHISCIARSDIFIQPKDGMKQWFCSRCLVGSCEFAFQPGPVYSLGDFQDLAEDFRDDYLKNNPELEDLDDEEFENEIEKRFWDSVRSTGDSITVEYGSDIHCSEKGSGFPIRAKEPYNRYSKDSWNLNNMPHHKDSLFHQIKSDISGMTVPWLYVGMMFSTFCWHSEDHYTYSVNYQHFGDTKTWYGIPGSDAEKFEQAMRDTVPELFEKQPNLLFQLVTMISPDILVDKGVKCYAIDQGPGEFVITFPKAYHSGFNHGFNCNEAVNFAPPDWVAYGAESVDTYQQYNRAPVFSHDSLLLRTAKVDMRPETAQWLFPHIDRLVERELARRKYMLGKHPQCEVEYVTSEVSEEDYQCSKCHSLPYLSRVTISRAGSAKRKRGATEPAEDAEYDDYDNNGGDGLDSDTDLQELLFGTPTVTDETASTGNNGALHTGQHGNNGDRISVCHLHVPEVVPKGLTAKVELMWTNEELCELRAEILKRRDEYGA